MTDIFCAVSFHSLLAHCSLWLQQLDFVPNISFEMKPKMLNFCLFIFPQFISLKKKRKKYICLATLSNSPDIWRARNIAVTNREWTTLTRYSYSSINVAVCVLTSFLITFFLSFCQFLYGHPVLGDVPTVFHRFHLLTMSLMVFRGTSNALEINFYPYDRNVWTVSSLSL